jgi:hypothetical protein
VSTAGQLAAALHRQADGICTMQAAASLLTAQAWLHRDDFTTAFATLSPDLPGEPSAAAIDWPAAIAALDQGQLPCSGGERRMLRLTASLAGGVPVDLREALSSLDQRNLDLLVTAIRHACGQPPGASGP